MATLTRSGYLGAAVTLAWTGGQSLNSLANNEWTNLSDTLTNATDKRLFADVELILASAAFSGATSGIEVYVVPVPDGTNAPTWVGDVTTDQTVNQNYLVGVVATTGTTSAQRLVLRDVEIPNGVYALGFRSRAGTSVTLAASGNEAKLYFHSVAS